MKKKSIKKVLITMRNVCLKNELCICCPLHDTVCVNTTDFTEKELEKAVNIIKEFMSNE